MALINSTKLTIQEVMPLLFNQWHLRDTNSGYGNKPTPNIAYGLYDFATATEDTDNVVFTVSTCSGNFWSNEARFYSNVTKVGFNMALQTGKRACIVRYTSDLGDGNTIYSWLLLCKDNSTIVTTSRYTPYGTSTPSKWGACRLDGNRSQGSYSFDISNSSMSTYGYNNATHTVDLTISNDANITNFYNDCYVVDGEKQYFNTILKHNYNYAWSYKHNGDATHVGFPNYLTAGETARYIFSIEKLPDFLPVFDVSDASAIISYLDTGDDGGKPIDPFDPNNPSIIKVTDFKTNFKISLTPASNKNGVKVSIIAYNQQYINGADVVAGSCVLHGESKLGSDTSYKGIGDNSLPKYPQITKSFDLVTDTTSNRWVYFVFRDVENVDNHSTWFGVDLIYSDKSASHCKIALVTGGDAINSGSACVRENITDGYRYTRTSTGEYVEIVFRSFDMDDLNDPYDDDDDTEDTSHGEDVDSGVGGKGLRTYAISSAQFEEINNALWSTDWTTVFKSNTINPVNCIMACKSIPFTASAISSGSVTIANLNTEVSANYVTPIKTISCGTITLDKYHKDFTDLTLTKVRVYMPYIGWRELPASEVIGRSAVPECGLLAHNKILSFKYLIDFVDGNCRCVISVNGTERFYFDGNCAIDVPVTSDNHTTAVGNAIKAGVQTVMSVGAGVASGVAGNAVGAVGGAISALQSLPNVVPTYQFTATTSPSGYIDASMPQKIIILIERPVYTVPDNYAHTTGRPCALTLPLGSLSGYTKCSNVDISGVSGTDRQRSEVKQLLESGVYL